MEVAQALRRRVRSEDGLRTDQIAYNITRLMSNSEIVEEHNVPWKISNLWM
jgi:hypothetical protein